MTAAAQAHNARKERKLRKPLIERKRRERINNCLDQLKETVIGAFRLDQSKLEKADILEMTVKHLQNIQNNTLNDSTLGIEAQQKYSTGYIQCMHEVHNMLLSCDWMDKTLGSRLLNHLLRSLPMDERPPQPSPRQDNPSQVMGVSNTSLRGDPLCMRQLHRAPSCPVSRQPERAPLHSSHLLEMWRPW